MSGIRLIVLDLIGTVIADDDQVERTFAETLGARGVEASGHELQAIRGLNKRDAIARLMPAAAPADVEATYETFRAALYAAFEERAVVLPGVSELLDWAAASDVGVAVNTGLDRALAERLLRPLRAQLRAVVCGEDVPVGRPAPYLIFRAMEATGTQSVHAVAVAGDTTADLHAGHNAGVRINAGVLTGAHTREQLARAPHTHLLADLTALPALLDDRALRRAGYFR